MSSKANRECISAVRSGHPQQVAKALRKGAEANSVDDKGTPILIIAAQIGNSDVVQLLLQEGADPSIRERNTQNTVLHATSDATIAKQLIGAGAPVSDTNTGDWTPLQLAASRNNPALASTLIEGGADPIRSTRRISAWRLALDNHALVLAMAKTLQPADLERPLTDCGFTPLMAAARARNWETVSFLVESGVDANAHDQNHSTALVFATRLNEHGDHCSPISMQKTVAILLTAGANTSTVDNKGYCALNYAMEWREPSWRDAFGYPTPQWSTEDLNAIDQTIISLRLNNK